MTTETETTSPTSATDPAEQTQAEGSERPAQTRGPDGRYLEKTPAQQPAAPKRYKLGDREVDPDELYVLASQRYEDLRGNKALMERAQRADMLEQALKEGRLSEVLGEEEEQRLALAAARRWKEREDEKNLPQEVREARQAKRELEALKAKLAEQEKAKQREEEARLDREEGERAVATIKEAAKATGLPQTPGLMRRIAAKMYANVQSGRNYPPHVVAHQVKTEWLAEQREAYKAVPPAQLLQMLPELLEKLDALDDDTLLSKLGKLGERLRTRNLAALGMRQPDGKPNLSVVPSGKGGGGLRLPDGREPVTPADFQLIEKLRVAGKM